MMMMTTMALMMVTLDSKHVSYVMFVIRVITEFKKIKNASKLTISINAFAKNEVPSRVRFV